MGTPFLLPDQNDHDSAPFWEGCSRGELLVQRCGECGMWAHPPRPMCHRCRSLDRQWVQSNGRGTIWSFVVPHPPLLAPYTDFAPYNVVIVALDDNPVIRHVGNLIAEPGAAINSVDGATIQIGEPVAVTFELIDDVYMPHWVRA